MEVLVNGSPVTLDKRSVLGSGGEGTVYKVSLGRLRKALKVYEHPTKARAEKLESFQSLHSHFTDRIIAPEELAYDLRGLVVGFTMPLLDGQFTEIASLINKKYRASYGITTRDVAKTFLDGIPTLRDIHSQGFVVGDFNDLNTLTRDRRMIWLDVDSWQFSKFPCPVATESYLDPALYGIDLSVRPVFTPGNDWYSYSAMLFRSLLLVHPYGGTHKTLNGILQRATRRVTVFDKGVTYPVIALSPDILTDDLHNVFDGYFAKGIRTPFPETKLREYLDSLRECTTCGTFFPGNRGVCPVCSAKTIIIMQKPQVSMHGIDVFELVRTSGQVLYVRVVGDEVRVIANEKGMVVLYTKKPNLPVTEKGLFAYSSGLKFEMTDKHLFVSYPGSSDLMVYDLGSTHLMGKLTTSMFVPARKAAFRASNENLFRIDGGDLKVGSFVGGSFEERSLRRVMEDQTWFWVDQGSSSPYVFGLFQVIRQHVYWMIKDGMFFDVAIPELESAETIIDVSVKFSTQGICLLRKTELKGKNYLRQEMIDGNNGRVLFTNRLEESSHANPTVHGQAYATGLVLHPTDEGIMQEKLTTGEIKTFPGTKGFVDGGDSLFRHGASIIVAKQDRVLQITLK